VVRSSPAWSISRKASPGLMHHSDKGVKYNSLSFGKRLEDEGLIPSKGWVGYAYDNALTEFFVTTLKTELRARSSWPTRQVVRTAFPLLLSRKAVRVRSSALPIRRR
jgi:transposase InsO family protein